MIESAKQGDTSRLLTALLDEADSAVLGLDTEGRIVHANEAAARAVGRDRRHLIGKPVVSLLTLPERRKVRAAFAADSDTPVTFEVTLAGRNVPVSLTLRRLPVIRPAAFSAKLDTQPPAEPAPTAATDAVTILDRFFLRFPHGVVGLNADRRVVFGNPRARHLLGDSAFRIGTALSPKALADFAERVVALPSVAQATRLELRDGRVLKVSGLGPRRDEPAVLILEDVTRDEEQNRVMHEFVRNAAHQLRTPLTGIATAVEVLQAGAKEDPEDRERFLHHIEVHAHRLIRIARGLLVLARAQSGEHLRFEFVEVKPLLEELAAQAEPRPGVELSIDCDPALAVLAERDLAYETLAALVDNAVEHTRHGTIQLTAADQDGRVAISVTDTGGSGVLPEHRERIFEPFYRPEASGKGFGLGLAIAAQATKAMDGELAVEDADRGARFTIRLPSGRILE